MSVLDLRESDFRDWLTNTPDRRGYSRSIGGSQVGALIGLNSYKTAADVFDELLELTPPMEGDDDTNRGHLMEPVIRELYARKTGRAIIPESAVKYRHFGHALGHALLDGIIENRDFEFDGLGGLEIKCHNDWIFGAMLTGGVDPSYYAQLQFYLGIHGFSWGAFALFNWEKWKLEAFDVEFDREHYEQISQAVEKFWNEHILTRQRPTEQPKVEVPTQAIRLGATELERTDERWMELVRVVKRQKEEFDIAKTALEGTKELMKEEMIASDAEVIRCNGTKISYKETTTRTIKKELLVAAGIDPAPFTQVTASRAFTMNFGRGG
jgi:predicted phage-related endonuclease